MANNVYYTDRILENFLPYDLDATFTSTIVLLMAAAIDSSLLHRHSSWSQRAYNILEEMSSRGNPIAEKVQLELKMLDDQLAHLSTDTITKPLSPGDGDRSPFQLDLEAIGVSAAVLDEYTAPLSSESMPGFNMNYGLDAEQLMQLANSLDLDSLTWPFTEDLTSPVV